MKLISTHSQRQERVFKGGTTPPAAITTDNAFLPTRFDEKVQGMVP
jgi:hypothetical protein